MSNTLNTRQIAERLGIGLDTARRLMTEMPRVNLSPAGTNHPRYGVSLTEFERWMAKRTAYKAEPIARKAVRKIETYRLEYR